MSFDTTRRDHLSVYGYSRATTPVLAEFARRGARFENAVAQQNLTLPSPASMLTGLYPHGHQSFSNEHILPESKLTLAEVLRGAGLRTAAFVSGYPLDDNWGLDQGFEVYDDDFDGMGRRGGLAVAGAIATARRWTSG